MSISSVKWVAAVVLTALLVAMLAGLAIGVRIFWDVLKSYYDNK